MLLRVLSHRTRLHRTWLHRKRLHRTIGLPPRLVAMIVFCAGSLAVTVVCAQAARLPGSSPSSSNTRPMGQLVLQDCLVQATQQIEVPAKEQGALIEMLFREGDHIREGEVIARIDDQRAQMELFAAETQAAASKKEAENENRILEAEAALRVAISDRDRAYRLLQKQGVTQADYEHAELTAEHAQLALQNRRYEKEIAILKSRVDQEAVKAAQQIVQRHEVVAPITGNIFRLLKRRGEWVHAGDPVFELARLDVLHVEGKFDGRQHNPEEVLGQPVIVRVERARGEIFEFSGKIVFVSPRQSVNQHYHVRAEVANRQDNGFWLLSPGALATMIIELR